MLIGLCGASGTGKTLLASIYLKQMGFIPYSVKSEVAAIARYFKSLSQEELKSKDDLKKLGGKKAADFLKDVRELGSKYSENGLFWVESIYDKYIKTSHPDVKFTVDDISTKTEADYIRSKGGYVVLLQKQGTKIPDQFKKYIFDLELPPEKNETVQSVEQFAYKVAEWASKLTKA